MKKILIIIGFLAVIALAAWLLFFRNTNTPIGEIIRTGLPFGSGEDINIPASISDDTVGEVTPFDEKISQAKIFRISNTPVSGFVVLSLRGAAVARYTDRATGHIYDAVIRSASTTVPIEKIRITNNTLPKIYESHFRSDGSAVLLRSLDDSSGTVENLALVLTPPRATSTNEFYSISATNIRGGIDSLVPGVGNILYYVLADTGAVVSSTFTGTELRTLFTSAFTNWRIGRLGAGLMLYTKASADAPGYAYSLAGGALTTLAGPLNGLTVIGSSDGRKILYSYFEGSGTKLFAKEISTSKSVEIVPSTLAEKCVWSAQESNILFCGIPITRIISKEPDGWYQGKTHFSDYLWLFDTNAEIAQLLINPKTEFGLDLDIFEPKLSPNEDFLIFINKRDLTLWGIKLQ